MKTDLSELMGPIINEIEVKERNGLPEPLDAVWSPQPRLPEKSEKPLKEKNQIEKDLRNLKAKIQRLETQYEKAKSLEISTEEEKQKKILALKRKEDIEAIERRKELIKAMKPDRKELQLLFQCASIFDNLTKRGIGFDTIEKKTITNLKNFLQTQ